MTLQAKPTTSKDLPVQLVHSSEGILGQLSVVEHRRMKRRALQINNIPQSLCTIGYEPSSAWLYVHKLAALSSLKQGPQSRALVIGLGGGFYAMELAEMEFDQIDVVEIDERLIQINQDFFGFEPDRFNIFIDDGRSFLNSSSTVYDLIAIDVCNGEVQPVHMFSGEAFEKLAKMMREDALLLFNFQGYLFGPKGLAARSIAKTLESSGFNVSFYYAGDGSEPGDLFFIASKTRISLDYDEQRLNPCCRVALFDREKIIRDSLPDLSDGILLSDDRPILETLHIDWIQEWRSQRIVDIDQAARSSDYMFFK